MKFRIITALAFIITISLSSCEKCMECSYTVLGVKSSGEQCGSKKDLEQFERGWRNDGIFF